MTDKLRTALEPLFAAAVAEAEKAMRKFPQPNYVISKVAEEAGEVVKAAIHCAEGRETPENVAGEIRQAMAMLIRLYVEGDQVHGLVPLAPRAALAAAPQPAPETMAWAVVGASGEIELVYVGHDRRELAEMIAEGTGRKPVRVAIRRVEGG